MKPHVARPAVAAWAFALFALPAAGQALQPADDLPPESRVREALLARPHVRAALAAVEAERAEAQRLRRGPEEFVLRAGVQQRRADEAGAAIATPRRFAETQIALERPWRSAAKAAQDETIGRAALELARTEAADAAHEASRALLREWFDWLRERGTVALWREQLRTQEQLLAQAGRRVKAGDAARTELRLQEAAWAQVGASLAAAVLREASARAALDLNYPGLTALAPAMPRLPQAQDLAFAADDGLEAMLEEGSHELRAAQAREQLAQARANRVALDARPDPTFGLHIGSERAGAERIVGVSVSIPLAGAARTDAARSAAARADEAALRREAVRLKVRTQARADRLAARAALDVWRRQEDARARLFDTAALLQRGWELGELPQSDALVARRQYVEAALAELAARTEARHAALRLQLDLHRIWDTVDD